MKIYILRHEKRYDSTDFDIELNEEGKNDAENLKYTLEKLNFDLIYCSPYRRIIQTIEPYLKVSKKKVRIENSMYECLMRNKNVNNIRDHTIDNLYGKEYYDEDYVSFLNVDKLKLGETFYEIKGRTTNFINNLIKKYEHTNKNILVVSHLTVINALLDRKPYDNYKQGQVVKIFDKSHDNTSCLPLFENCIKVSFSNENVSRWLTTNKSACFKKIN